MSLRPLNSVGGFSVGETPANIILANGDITTTAITVSGVSNLGPISNVVISGGSDGYLLKTDGSGTLSWIAPPSTSSIVNGTSNISIPATNGNVNTSVGGNANVFVVTGTGVNVAGTLNATGNANVGNIGTTGNVEGANIVSANIYVTTLGTGQVAIGSSGGKLVGGPDLLWDFSNAELYSTGFVSNRYVTATGNITGGNIITGGNVWANSGTVKATTLIGEGGNISNITGANVTGQVGNALVAGTVYTAAQPNITSVGTLTGLTVNGLTNLGPNGNITISGGTSGQYLQTDGSGNLSWHTVGTAGITNGTSNIDIPVADGNVNTSVAGNANVFVVTGTGVNVSGTLNSTGNANVGNLGTAQVLATANITAPQLISNISTGTAPFVVTSTTQVANLNVATAGSATTAGTVTIAAQPNITSVGVLNELLVANTILADGYAARTGSDLTISTSGNGNLIISTAGTGITDFSGKPVSNISTISVTGNANVGNIGAAIGVFTGNVTAANVWANSGTVKATTLIGEGGNISNITGANVTGTVASATSATTAGTVTTAAQPNITSVGTLTSLTVSGNANVGNLGTAQVLATANVTAPQLISNIAIGTAPFVVTSTTVVANLNVDTVDGYDTSITSVASTIVVRDANANIYANNISGTLTTATQTNITSVGTLGSLAVTANITAGNVYANSGTIGASLVAGTLTTAAQPNITSVGTLSSLAVTANVAAGNLTTTGVLSVTGTSESSIAGNLNMNSKTITNLAEPNNATDAATKSYVDAAVTGLHVHDSCYVATTTTLATSTGGTVTYNNGTGGVNANLVTTGTFLLIDGGNVQTVGTRILVKNETNAAWNGIYTYANTTTIVRAADFDTSAEAAGGDFAFVTSGSTQADTGWVQTTDNPTIGTSPIVWTQFSGAGTYQAGTGLNLDGTIFNISNTTVTSGSYGSGDRVASFTVNDQGQLTAAANVVNAPNAANLTGTTLASGVVNSSLTSVGTLTSLTVSGNATVGNLLGVFANGNSNVSIPSANGNVNISAVGNANVVVVTGTGANIGGTLNATGNANVGNLGTAQVLASANITTPVLISNVSTGTAPLTVISTTRVANLNVATAGVANTVNDAAQPNITSVGTLTSLGVNGTITAVNITANTGVFTGNANGLSSLQGANIVGTINSTTLGNSTLYVGTTAIALNRGSGAQSLTGITSIDGYAATVSTAAQPNITSVGTLTSLTVSGTATVGNLSTAGNVVAADITANNKVTIGNTTINWAQVTTSATTANQTISTVSVTGITGVEWLVKGSDATGAKYSVATVHAVTDGANVDWSIYGGATLGSTTGTISVAISSGNIILQVTPSSANSTVWVTQYKYI